MSKFIVGDKVVMEKPKRYGIVENIVDSWIIVRFKNGKLRQVAENLLRWNYGKRRA
jgi:hypothetical protein